MTTLQTFHSVLATGVLPRHKRNRTLRFYLADLLAKGGGGRHSVFGDTLPMLLAGLEEAKVPYILHYFPGGGYVLTVPPPERRGRGDLVA